MEKTHCCGSQELAMRVALLVAGKDRGTLSMGALVTEIQSRWGASRATAYRHLATAIDVLGLRVIEIEARHYSPMKALGVVGNGPKHKWRQALSVSVRKDKGHAQERAVRCYG